MHVEARRVFRLSLTMALALACAYGLALPLPFLAPLFALLLTAAPAPPMGPNPDEMVPDFSLADVNPTSTRFGEAVSPRDYLNRISAWYFGSAT